MSLKEQLSQKWLNKKDHLLIVNFIGAKGSGKDSCADKLIEKMGLSENDNVSFASGLKDFVWDHFQGQIKDPGRIYGEIDKKEEKMDWWPVDENLRRRFSCLKQHTYWTGRLLLQWFGTEIMRGVYDNIWVEKTVRKLEQKKVASSPIVFTTDCRFPNEHKALKHLGHKEGITNVFVRIDRPSLVQKDCHASEAHWKHMEFDHQIYNDTSIEHLHDKAEEILRKLLS